MIPVLVLAVPLVDLTLVVFSRIRRGVNPFTTGGTDHLSHRLVRRGMTRREAVLVHYLVGCAAAGLGILASHTEPSVALMLLGAAVVLAGWVIWQLDRPARVPESPLAGDAT
jgi:UDP-GlcNAc:undecaprenyl-phosphate GlcNAc-1-phosphate transferase